MFVTRNREVWGNACNIYWNLGNVCTTRMSWKGGVHFINPRRKKVCYTFDVSINILPIFILFRGIVAPTVNSFFFFFCLERDSIESILTSYGSQKLTRKYLSANILVLDLLLHINSSNRHVFGKYKCIYLNSFIVLFTILGNLKTNVKIYF